MIGSNNIFFAMIFLVVVTGEAYGAELNATSKTADEIAMAAEDAYRKAYGAALGLPDIRASRKEAVQQLGRSCYADALQRIAYQAGMEAFVLAGGDVNQIDGEHTKFAKAMCAGSPELIEFIVLKSKQGINLSLQNTRTKQTVLDVAKEWGYENLLSEATENNSLAQLSLDEQKNIDEQK